MNRSVLEVSAILWPLGRTMLGLFFAGSALRRYLAMHGPAVKALSDRGLPYAGPFTHFASVYQIAAGVMLALDLFVVYVAASLIGFILVASYLMLDFWNKTGPQRQAAEGMCLSNIGHIGSLCVVIAYSLRWV